MFSQDRRRLERLQTERTLMWTLLRVLSHMTVELALGDEPISTVLTDIRAFTRVTAHVDHQVIPLLERLLTRGAHMRPLCRVYALLVQSQIRRAASGVATYITLIRPLIRVDAGVDVQVVFPAETLAADGALVATFAVLRAVLAQSRGCGEHGTTGAANVSSGLTMGAMVGAETGQGRERLAASLAGELTLIAGGSGGRILNWLERDPTAATCSRRPRVVWIQGSITSCRARLADRTRAAIVTADSSSP